MGKIQMHCPEKWGYIWFVDEKTDSNALPKYPKSAIPKKILYTLFEAQNAFYDENKLDPEENDTFKQMIKYLVDEAQHSGFISKFKDSRLFNVNYLTVKELNGEDIDLIGGWDFSLNEVEDLHDKLYGESESLNENEKNIYKSILEVKDEMPRNNSSQI
jgi:hypothetical protein